MLITKIGEEGYGGDVAEGVDSIIQTTDEGYIVAGFTSSFGSGDSDFWIVKLDVSGNIQWQKSLNFSKKGGIG